MYRDRVAGTRAASVAADELSTTAPDRAVRDPAQQRAEPVRQVSAHSAKSAADSPETRRTVTRRVPGGGDLAEQGSRVRPSTAAASRRSS